MSNTNTDFSNKCKILGDLWMNYRTYEEFEDFIEYNDIGLPLAFILAEELATPTEQGQVYINETWLLLLETLGVVDLGYDDLNQLLGSGETNN